VPFPRSISLPDKMRTCWMGQGRYVGICRLASLAATHLCVFAIDGGHSPTFRVCVSGMHATVDRYLSVLTLNITALFCHEVPDFLHARGPALDFNKIPNPLTEVRNTRGMSLGRHIR